MTYADVRHWYEDPDDPDMPNGHCDGTDAHKCGRFVAAGAFHCARCLEEMEDAARWEAAEDARIAQAIADEQAHWEQYWASPAGQAERAEYERQAREWEAELDGYAQDGDGNDTCEVCGRKAL